MSTRREFIQSVPAASSAFELVTDQSGGNIEVLFRLYGPQKPLFDKTWKLPDRSISCPLSGVWLPRRLNFGEAVIDPKRRWDCQ